MIIKVMVCKFTIIFVWKQKIYIFATEKRLKTIKNIFCCFWLLLPAYGRWPLRILILKKYADKSTLLKAGFTWFMSHPIIPTPPSPFLLRTIISHFGNICFFIAKMLHLLCFFSNFALNLEDNKLFFYFYHYLLNTKIKK